MSRLEYKVEMGEYTMRKEKLGLNKNELIEMTDNYILGYQCERNKQIFLDFEIRGKTYEKIAEEREMSVGQIKVIVKKCTNIIKSALETGVL